jgi:hypothetical protein
MSEGSMSNQQKRQLVVVVKPNIGLHVGLDPSLAPTMAAGDIKSLVDILKAENIVMRPLFGKSEDRLRAMAPPFTLPGAPNAPVWDLSAFYVVDAPDERLNHLAQRFSGLDHVAYVYIEPQVSRPMLSDIAPPIASPPPSITDDLSARQGYLDSAPGGIDARFAQTLTGGTGTGVQIIDIEGDWRLTHEDLLANMGGLISGTRSGLQRDVDHGTAVFGTIGGDDNGFGVVGIAPDANLRAISHSNMFPSGIAAAIGTAANALSAGDIILIEAQAPGPRFDYDQITPTDQRGLVAMQFWPAVYAAITFATVVKGIIVIEAAGNGSEDLDDPIYNNVPSSPKFPIPPPFWSPFNRSTGDNASIIVGAGAPPPGMHGRDWGPDRSRFDFSNFGSCIDAQGWGTEITSCGYGNFLGGPDQDRWYTDTFGGTSGASAMITGALACMQGVLKAAGKPLLTPIKARSLLQDFGSAQQDAPGRPATQRIGNRPDLFLMMASIV